jgi:hypothetical protein
LRLDVPHNMERTIEMLSAKETAIHLENLRQSHEITRQLQASVPPSIKIILKRDLHCWTANGVPLPFHISATYGQVAAFVAKRFKHEHGARRSADITVRV